MKLKNILALLITCATINIHACYVIPKIELENPEDKIETIAILSDITVFNKEGEKYALNLPQSIELSKLASDTLKNLLESKNFNVNKMYPPAPGYLLTKTGGFYKTYYSKEDYNKPFDSLKIASPPFNLMEEHLDTFLTAAIIANKDFYKSTFTANDMKAKSYKCLLVFQAFAYEESINPENRKSWVSDMFSGNLSDPPYIDACCWIIDSETGKTLYSDRYILNRHITPAIIDALMSYFKWAFR